MNYAAIRQRLSQIIALVSEEKVAHPNIWYPLDSLLKLDNLLNRRNDDSIPIIQVVGGIKYAMFDCFHSYEDSVYGIVVGFCSDIEKLFAIHDAIDIFVRMNSVEFSESISELLREWFGKIEDDGSIDYYVSKAYGDQFAKRMLEQPAYFKQVLPPYVISALSSAAGSDLWDQLRNAGVR